VRAALAAGAIIRDARSTGALEVREKKPNDFVTQVDLASEKVVLETLLAAYPQHAVRSEESAQPHGNATSDHVWIVDPLDGTTNFIRGYPQVAVSIALAIRGQIAHGVVLDVWSGELFHASRGRGAWCGARRLQVSDCSTLESAVLATNCLAQVTHDPARSIALLSQVLARVTTIRRSGSAALDLARIAAGQCDGGFDQCLSAWDVAAGSLLITEAGGRVGNFLGEADYLETREFMAASPGIFEALRTLLAPYSHCTRPGA